MSEDMEEDTIPAKDVAAALKALEEAAKAGLMPSEMLFAINEIRCQLGLEEVK